MKPPRRPLPLKWFRRPATSIAPELIGKILVQKFAKGKAQRFVITETEAYLSDDPASHSFKGRTLRNASMFASAGTIYIYFIYGMHHCLNIVTGERGRGEAVLIRGLAPLDPRLQAEDYAGPAKLCRELGLNRAHDGLTLSAKVGPIWIEDDPRPPEYGALENTPRVGISKGVDKLWRWRIKRPA